jgi:hypothetical protein
VSALAVAPPRFISDDTARCVGRFGLRPDDAVCERRAHCLRYIALLQWPADVPIPLRISVHTGLCRDGDDYLIEGEA